MNTITRILRTVSRGLRTLATAGLLGLLLMIGAACEPPEVSLGVNSGGTEIYQGQSRVYMVSGTVHTRIVIKLEDTVGIALAPTAFDAVQDLETRVTVRVAPTAAVRQACFVVYGSLGRQPKVGTAEHRECFNIESPFSLVDPTGFSGRAGQLITGVASMELYDQTATPFVYAITGLPSDVVATASLANSGTFARNIDVALSVPATTPPRVYAAALAVTRGSVTRTLPLSVTVDAPLPGPDFSMQVMPTVVDLLTSAIADVNLTFARNSTITGNIDLSIAGLPAGVSAIFVPTSASGGSSQLRLTSNSAAPVGPVNVTVTAVNGSLVRTATITLTVVPNPDFTIAANPATVTFQNPTTTAASVALAIARIGNVGAVALEALNVPNGIVATFNATPTASSASTLVLTPNGAVAAGNYTVTVRATSGSIVRTVNVGISVLPPAGDFTATFNAASYTVAQGSTTLLSLLYTRTGTMIGASISLAGTTLPPQSTATGNPTTSINGFVSLVVGANAPVGSYPLTMTASSGALVRSFSTTVNITVPPPPGFTLVPNPSTFRFPIGTLTPFSVSIVRVGGFAGAVSFTHVNPFPGNMIVEYTPTSASTTGNSISLNLYVSPNIAPGTYTLPLTGTSGVLTQTINIQFTVF